MCCDNNGNSNKNNCSQKKDIANDNNSDYKNTRILISIKVIITIKT